MPEVVEEDDQMLGSCSWYSEWLWRDEQVVWRVGEVFLVQLWVGRRVCILGRTSWDRAGVVWKRRMICTRWLLILSNAIICYQYIISIFYTFWRTNNQTHINP
jgi:hypothetical protein